MTREQYDRSIKTGELQLNDLFQRLMYFGGVIFLFTFPIIFITFPLIDLINGDQVIFTSEEIWVIIPAILGMLEYRRQKKNLVFDVIPTKLTSGELYVIIETTSKELEWTQLSYDDLAYVGATYPGFSSLLNWGEQITIIFAEGKIMINSVNNPNSKPALFDMGRNKMNRVAIINRIRAEAV